MDSKYLMAHELVPLNKSQARSIEYLCDYIAEGCSDIGEEEITSVELKASGWDRNVFWVTIKTEHVASPHSLLSALCDQYWLVQVGKRGALEAHMYPKSYQQFIGSRRVHDSGCHFVK